MTTSPDLSQQILVLVAGIGGVLLVASLTGLCLKVAVARREPHVVIDNLNTRIKAWWAIAVIVGIALYFGTVGVTLLFAFASSVALREFTSDLPIGRSRRAVRFAAFFVILPAQYLFAGLGWHELHALFIPSYALIAILLPAVAAGGRRGFVAHASAMHSGLMVCVFSISHVPALFALDIPGYAGRNAFLVLFLILVVQASDVLQYVFGKLCGRHRIAPEISPSKTIEGYAGGVLSATAIGAALAWTTPFSVVQAGLIALTITLLGALGGLVLSAIKRDRGIKDWGAVIPGHGGMLDRLDSLCFSAPIYFYIVRCGWSA